MKQNNEGIGIRSMAARLGGRDRELPQLAEAGLLVSSPGALRELGFQKAYSLGNGETIYDLVKEAALEALNRAALTGTEIDSLIWSGALPESHSTEVGDRFLGRFNYPASRLQWELGLEDAHISAVAQQGCCSQFNALQQAVMQLQVHPEWNHVLCVAGDALPADAPREILYNLISDAASAVVVSRKEPRYLWRHEHQVSRGYYWDVPGKEREIMAAYFPTSRLVLNRLVELEGGVDSIQHVIATGVSPASWKLLGSWCGLAESKIHTGHQSFGHTISADTFLKWIELVESGAIRRGDILLCFTYGFGSSWSGFTVEARS